MKKITILCLMVLFVAALPVFANGDRDTSGPFSWNMALINARTGEMVPFSAPVQSSTGERFQLVIEAESTCYLYVIAISADETEADILYAGLFGAGQIWYSQILELVPPQGSESLYVITSLTEQQTLAQRITAYNANSGATQRRALVNEIFRIRSDASRFREEPEKPVLMGGATRGEDKGTGVEYSGSEIYVKTISIEH